MANATPKTRGECVLVCVHPCIAYGVFHVSGEAGCSDCCCGCREPSEQQSLGEEKQRQDAEGVKAADIGLTLPARTKGCQLGLPGRRDRFFCT